MISFFFQERGAGLIRGRQMGEYLGAKLNPTEGYEDDICIYVKSKPPDPPPRRSYIDIVDGPGLVSYLSWNPSVGVITTSLTGKQYLETTLKQKVHFIPENHCNYLRETRTVMEPSVVGTIGNLKGFDIPIDTVHEELKKHGFEFKFCNLYTCREDVVNFYKTIDIQICWRPHVMGLHALLHNPLKLANACSFGIPTVAWPEANFVEEFFGLFVPATTPERLWESIEELRHNRVLYQFLSENGIAAAEDYHIEHVSKLYDSLV